jgi:hypothetical protein
MRQRLAKVRRILRVQEQLARVEEWKLAALERRGAEVEAAERELIGALNADHELHGLFLDVMARRLCSLSEEAGRICAERDAQASRVRAQSAKLRMAERMLQTATAELRGEEAKRDLLDLIDDLAGRERASLP